MDKSAKRMIYAFDQFRLDADAVKLYRDGQPVKLPPRVVKILIALVEKRGSIVSKEYLIDAGNENSGEKNSNNLSRQLYLLRKTLGTKPGGTAYIETIQRQGYRFASDEVTVETDPAARGTEFVEIAPDIPSAVDTHEKDSAIRIAQPDEDAPFAHTEIATSEVSARKLILAGAVALAVLALVGFVFWFQARRSQQVGDGRPATIELLPLTQGEYVADATISLDGQYIAYHEIDGEFTRILVQQTGQPKPIEVVQKGKRLVGAKTFSPDGQFIYYLAREADAGHSSVYRVPTLGGVQTKVAENSLSYVSLSPDGRSLAYVKSDPVYSLVVAASDGTGERTLISAESSSFFAPNPAWSPDGRSIAFGNVTMDQPAPGKCTISSLDLDSMKLRAISSDLWETCSRIEWRRDGKGVVFVGTKMGDANTIRRDQVYYMNVADGRSRKLTSDPSRKQPDSLGVTQNNEVLAVPFTRSSQLWVTDAKGRANTASRLTSGSADGPAGLVPLRDGRIAFITRTGEKFDISIVDADGGNRHQILGDLPAIGGLTATADAKYLFFSHEKDNRTHLFRVDADGTNIKQITDGEDYQTDSTTSPDGRWIAFDSTPTPGGGQRIWKTSIEGGAPTQISDQPCTVPRYSPSGKFISCASSPQLFVLSPEDGKVVKTFSAVQIGMLNIGVRWTPDEKSLVYIASQKGTTNLWIQPLDGKPARQLTDFVDGDIYNFAYSHDGSKLYLARGYQVRDAILIKNFQ